MQMVGRSISIVGTSHALQHHGAMTALKLNSLIHFRFHLISTAGAAEITLLAEEFSEYSLQISGTDVSTVRDVAKHLHLAHLFADPNPGLRIRFDIRTDRDREKFWLSQLEQRPEEKILFVCGDDHVDSFASLLRDRGAEVEIVSRGWGREVESEGGAPI